MSASHPRPPPRRLAGRYALHDVLGLGGMATVHLGRLVGSVGFARTVAIKRLHPHLAANSEIASMFLAEARLMARVRHPNVVPTTDVVEEGEEVFLVMEYVPGEVLSRLDHDRKPTPAPVASAIVSGVLHGLHAAHTAKGEQGEPLEIVHRDVSPQNIIVGVDGVARLLDFGIAKARGHVNTTREGFFKGKLAYVAPEQIRRSALGPRTDVYAAAVVLWELLSGRQLFTSDDEAALMQEVLVGFVEPPSTFDPRISEELDALVLRGLDQNPDKRFASAREMALELERCAPPALATAVAEWLESNASAVLQERAATVARIEAESHSASASGSGAVARFGRQAAGSGANARRVIVASAVLLGLAGVAVASVSRRGGSHPSIVTREAAPPLVSAPPANPIDPPAPSVTAMPSASARTPRAAGSVTRPLPRPVASKGHCERIDPKTGDIVFGPDCR